MSELEWNQSVRFALVRILDVVGAAAIRVGRDEVFEVDASFENGVAALNKWGLHIRKEDGKDNTEQFGRHGTCQALMALMLGNCVLRQRTQAPTHYDKFIVGGLHWLLATHNSKAEDHVAKRVSDYNKTFKLAHIALTLNTGINQPAPFAQVRKVINRTLIKGGKNCKWAWSLSGKGEPQLLPTLIALRALCSEPNYLVENKEDIKSALFWVLETCKSDPNNDVNVAALLQTCAMLPLLLKQPFFADLIHALHEVFRQNQPATGQQGDVFIHYYDWKVKNRPLSIQYCRMPLWLMDTAYRLERYLEFGGNEAERIDLTSRLSGLLATTNHQWVEKFQLVEPYAWLARIFAACSQVGAYKCLFNSQAALAIQQSVKLPTALSIGHLAIESQPDAIRTPSVLLCASEWSPSKGGLSTFNRELAIGLAKTGASVTCVAWEFDSSDVNAAHDRGVILIKPTPQPGVKVDACYDFNLPNGNPDIVIGHDSVTGPYALHLKKLRFKKAKFVLFIHTTPWPLEQAKGTDVASSKAETKERLLVDLCKDAQLVVPVGPYIGREIRGTLDRLTDKPPIFEFGPGPYPDLHPRETLPISQEKICLFIGRAEDPKSKGIDFLLIMFEAYLDNSQTLKNVQLVLRGFTLEDQTNWDKKIGERRFPPGKVRVRKYTTDQTLIDEDFQSASVVLMPSRVEGYGLVALEAISRGIPVLASKESGFGMTVLNHCGGELASRYICAAPLEGCRNESVINEWIAKLFAIVSRDPNEAKKDALFIRQRLIDKGFTWENQARILLRSVQS